MSVDYHTSLVTHNKIKELGCVKEISLIVGMWEYEMHTAVLLFK